MLNALLTALTGNYLPTLATDIVGRAGQVDPHDIRAVTGLFEQTARMAGGLLLVVDELGKSLEYVTHQPYKFDVSILQLLAEAAARSSSNPLLFLAILHQPFALYGLDLPQSQRQELAKVQGRFEDVAFQEPSDQVLRLVHAAIDTAGLSGVWSTYRAKAKIVADQAVMLQLAPPGMPETEAGELLAGCAPLHPLTVLLLGPLFRRVGQNERSVFAFLSSNEPSGFQEFLAQTPIDQIQFYTVDRLYDYLLNSCATSLYHDPVYGRRWAQVEAAIGRLRHVELVDARIIKTIGLMNALGEQGHIRPSERVLAYALDLPGDVVKRSLKRLASNSIVVHRAFLNSYRLWDGSDLDIEGLLTAARATIGRTTPLHQLLTHQLERRPIVARRHSYRTGALRFFHVEFTNPDDVGRTVAAFRDSPSSHATGLVVYVLSNGEPSDRDLQTALADFNMAKQDDVVVIPIDVPLSLREALLELEALRWVQANAPELQDDAVARLELRARYHEMQQVCLQHIGAALAPSSRGLKALHAGTSHQISGPRQLNALLSRICDKLYSESPPIKNELVNRDSLSCAATAARRVLLQRMIEANHLPRLGIKGHPPELAIYLSLFSPDTMGLHVECQEGRWGFVRPSTKSFLAPTWSVWEQFLDTTLHGRRRLSELCDLLRERPIGLKNGVIPILLCAMLLERQSDVALYESGTLVAELTSAHAERLLRSPDKFEIRYCPMSGQRADVLNALHETGLISNRQCHVVGAVRPLFRFLASLPQYSQCTRAISQRAQEVRQVLMTAREPDVLLFEQLPGALGLCAFAPGTDSDLSRARRFAQDLNDALRELETAYPGLTAQISELVARSFAIPGELGACRAELRLRAGAIEELAGSPRVRAFIRRLADPCHDDQAWLESLATFLTSHPPQTWRDDDLVRFGTELDLLASQFRSLEDIRLAIGRTSQHADANVGAVRLALVVAGDKERHRVVVTRKDLEPRIRVIANQLLSHLRRLEPDEEAQLAVMGHILRSLLREPESDQGLNVQATEEEST